MEYDRKSVDEAIKQASERKVFLVHTIETVATTYEVVGYFSDTLKDVEDRFIKCQVDPQDLKVFDTEGLNYFVDEVEESQPHSEAA